MLYLSDISKISRTVQKRLNKSKDALEASSRIIVRGDYYYIITSTISVRVDRRFVHTSGHDINEGVYDAFDGTSPLKRLPDTELKTFEWVLDSSDKYFDAENDISIGNCLCPVTNKIEMSAIAVAFALALADRKDKQLTNIQDSHLKNILTVCGLCEDQYNIGFYVSGSVLKVEAEELTIVVAPYEWIP